MDRIRRILWLWIAANGITAIVSLAAGSPPVLIVLNLIAIIIALYAISEIGNQQ